MPTVTIDPKQPDGPTFAASLAGIEAGNYLGSLDLMDELVRGWVSELMHASSPDEAIAACNRLAVILAGGDPNFTPVPEWHTREALGFVVAERLGVDPDQPLLDILRTGLAIVGTELMNVGRDFVDNPDADWGWIVDEKIAMLRSLFLGTIDLTHPKDSGEARGAEVA